MTLSDAFQYISNDETRVSKPGLERIHACMELLGSPERELKLIHVVGTNGKGSVTTMLSASLTALGYRVGMMTSPYLDTLLDHFRIDGQFVAEEQFVTAVERLQATLADTDCRPTEFELAVAVGILIFESAKCDFVILEAGMGGRKDATNLNASSVMTVVTQLGIDHQQFLGSTLAEIAEEKLGIADEGEPIVLGPNVVEMRKFAENHCEQHGQTLYTSEEYYCQLCLEDSTLSNRLAEHELRLSALYQKKNIATVLTALDALTMERIISEYDLCRNPNVIKAICDSYLPYRFDIRSRDPYLIMDGGHNPDCILSLCQALNALDSERRYHIITGVMRDKDYPTMYRMLSEHAKSFCVVTPNNSRALPAFELAEHLQQYEVPILVVNDMRQVAEQAVMWHSAGEDVLICGSLYMMHDIDQAINEILTK